MEQTSVLQIYRTQQQQGIVVITDRLLIRDSNKGSRSFLCSLSTRPARETRRPAVFHRIWWSIYWRSNGSMFSVAVMACSESTRRRWPVCATKPRSQELQSLPEVEKIWSIEYIMHKWSLGISGTYHFIQIQLLLLQILLISSVIRCLQDVIWSVRYQIRHYPIPALL